MRTTWTESANALIEGARISAGYCTQIEILENAIRTLATIVDERDATERKPEDEARRGYMGGMPERMPAGPYDLI